jgi:hypothetical protein
MAQAAGRFLATRWKISVIQAGALAASAVRSVRSTGFGRGWRCRWNQHVFFMAARLFEKKIIGFSVKIKGI